MSLMNSENGTGGYYINPDVILRIVDNRWIASNPRLRAHVELDEEAARKFVRGGTRNKATKKQWLAILSGGKGKDCTRRGVGEGGLVADHSGFLRNSAAEMQSGDDLFELLRKKRVLITSHNDAIDPVKKLSGLFDQESLGTFHQRVGQYLLLERRSKEPWREWQNQKFSVDGVSLLDTPYRQLQEPFFDRLFTKERVQGLRILDFGCGNAYYTSKFAQRGALVTGVDNSAELLGLARINYSDKENLELILTSTFEEVINLLSAWESDSFDLIYLQDTLLLLINPEVGEASPCLQDLIIEFRRLIGSEGRLCAMEPNPIFWLANRYGDQNRPYAVITEYRHAIFNVAPYLDEILQILGRGGFALKNVQHPWQETVGSNKNSEYQNEYPIWDYYEFVPV